MSSLYLNSLEFSPFFPTLSRSCYSPSRQCSLAPWPSLNRWGMFCTTLRHAVRLNWAWRTPYPDAHMHTSLICTPLPPLSSHFSLHSWRANCSLPIPQGEDEIPGPERVNLAPGLSPGLTDWLAFWLSPPHLPCICSSWNDNNYHYPYKPHWYAALSLKCQQAVMAACSSSPHSSS